MNAAALFTWWASLGWAASLCFAVAIAVALCIIVVLIDSAIVRFARWNELRAIRRRLWEAKKERVSQLLEDRRKREQRENNDAEFLRRLGIDIANDDAQGRREAKQFHIPAAFRDMKGVHRQ